MVSRYLESLSAGCVYAILLFPLIDFPLRHLLPFSFLGSLWYVLVFVILALQTLAVRRRREVVPYLRWTRFAYLYIVCTLLLTIAGWHHPKVAFAGFRADVYYLGCALCIPYAVKKDKVPSYLHTIAILAVLMGVHGIYQYLIAVPIPPSWVDVHEHLRTRVFSLITSPNELGAYMALMEPLLLGLFVAERDRMRKWMYGLGFLVCFATHLFTFDRGSLIALTAAACVTALLINRKLLILILVVGAIAFFLPPIHHRFLDLFSPLYIAKSWQGGRLLKWHQAYQLWLHHPLFGVGIGRYGGSVASEWHLSTYSDNYYAKVLAESGLVGLLSFLAMHFVLLREVYQKSIRNVSTLQRPVAIGGFVGLLAIVFHNCVENVFEYGPVTLLYFGIAILLLIWADTPTRNGEAQLI